MGSRLGWATISCLTSARYLQRCPARGWFVLPAHVPRDGPQFKGVEPMVANAGQSHAIADQLGSDPLMRRDPMYTREVTNTRRDSQIRRAPNSAGLYEVLDL